MIRELASTAILCALAISLPSFADVLVLNDGREYRGVVLSEDENAVRFEAHHHGMRMTMNVPRSNIKSLQQVDRNGTPYVRIPVHGRIGTANNTDRFVTADGISRALEHARSKDAEYIILHIDSGGGSVDEMQEILRVMQRYSDLTFVAHVEQALSAAAIIALACEDIVMTPSARIGATVAWKMAPDGTPDNIEEKFISMLRATLRSAARAGGHNVLLARGMMEDDLRLLAVEQDDGTVRITDDPSSYGRVIKEAGRVLTLTTNEAIEYGLAIAEASSNGDVLHAASIESGYEVDDLAWHMVINDARLQSRHIAKARERAMREVVRDEYLRQAYPRVQEIHARLIEVEATIRGAEETERDLLRQRHEELRTAYDEYRARYNRARHFTRVDQRRAAAANEWYRAEKVLIKNRIDPQITAVRQQLKEAIAERDLLIDELDGWIESTPEVD